VNAVRRAPLAADPAKDGTARLFVALWPDAAVRAALADRRDRWQWNTGARPVRTDKLHLTLHFLGAVPRARLPELRSALRRPFVAFELEFGRATLWPRGLAVIEPVAVPPPLRELHAALGEALLHLGLPCETAPWRPHVTLARRAAAAAPPAEAAALHWPVRGYALVESCPSPGRYSLVHTWP
jgi:RNA 2',3'-cyclic 3'-phosphodiesterase